MSHFAKVINGIVIEVIAAEQEVIDSGVKGPANEWIQTSYNTRHGVRHNNVGGVPLRGNFAGIGFCYSAEHDVFHPPRPSAYPSFVLDTEKWLWKPPISYPTDEKTYQWNEENQVWTEIVLTETPPG